MNEKIQICISLLALLFAGVSLHGAAGSSQGDPSKSASMSETLLASVSIEDLIGSSRKKRDAKAEKAASEEEKQAIEAEQNMQLEQKQPLFLLDETAILDELKTQLAQHFGLNSDFRLYLDKPWETIKLRSPIWHIVITSFPAQGLRSRFYLEFELWLENKRHANWQLGVRSELWEEAYVTLQSVDRETQLNSSLVEIRPVDVLSLYQSPVEIGTDLRQYVAARGLKAGSPLYWRDLHERPLVSKNSIIDVVAEEGLMKISLKAKALENGVKGQLIRVRNLQSYNDIQAEVIGVNQAKVYF
jgi:flagella basal body P-ring formation protein FlgA